MNELELLRKIVAECVGLSDLLKMGMSVDDGNALLARCENNEPIEDKDIAERETADDIPEPAFPMTDSL